MTDALNDMITLLNYCGETLWSFGTVMFAQVCVLVTVLLLIDLFLRHKIRAVSRYWLWTLVLLKLVLPVTLYSPISAAYWLTDYVPTVSMVDVSVSEVSPVEYENSKRAHTTSKTFSVDPMFVPETTPHLRPVSEVPSTSTTEFASTHEVPAIDTKREIPVPRQQLRPAGILFISWLSVVALLCGIVIRRTRRVRQLTRQAVTAPVEIVNLMNKCCKLLGAKQNVVQLKISDHIGSPAICGLWKPTILLPRHLLDKLDLEQIRQVLTHELTHWKRYDLHVNCLQTLLQILYFYNPMVWIANAILRRLREQAVDETVLVTLNIQSQLYSSTLLDIAALTPLSDKVSLQLIGIIEPRKPLAERIRRIVSRPIPRSAKLGLVGFATIVLTGMILLPMSSVNRSQALAETNVNETQVNESEVSEAKEKQKKSTTVAVQESAEKTERQSQQKTGHVVIDGVNFRFGQIVEVVGPCLTTDSDMLGFSYAQASLLGLRIDGRANQANIAFHLLAESKEDRKKLNSLKKDAYYKVRGRLTGARMSGPKRACNLVVEHIDAVPSAPLMPKDFLGRVASFEGVAQPNGTLKVNGEVLHLVDLPTWPENVVGKTVHVLGSVGQGPQGWQLSMATWNLANLVDRVGQDVSLDGVLFSLNDHWWFDYRGERLYLTSDAGPQLSFSSEHGRLATATGKLVRQLRPSLKQITEKSDRDLVLTYVVRGAKVTFRDDSKTWYERFGFIYSGKNKVSDGVPELLAELSFRKNLMGYETETMRFAERNEKTISSIIQNSTPAVRDVLARRMNDVQVNRSLRLLYAAILARVNDERGREFLKNLAESPGNVPKEKIYYCLGVFPFLGTNVDKKIDTDCKWAEQTLIAIMSNPKSNEVAFRYSSIPHVLIKINTSAARKVLLDYALQTESKSEFFFRTSVVPLLCTPSVQLPAENLLQLEAVAKDGSSRRAILRALLRLKDPAVVERFLGEIENGFVYMDFRDLSSPEILELLSPLLPKLTGKSKSNVQMLLVLGKKDPVPALIALLNDRKYPDKNLVMFELARIADDRAIKPVARILREAHKDYFKIDFTLVDKGIAPKQASASFSAPILTNANASYTGIRHALEALAKTHKRSAVQELIDLLGMDLGRFGGDTDKAGFQRIIAAHLIEMTGESFGVDQIGWRKWERAQPDERFRALESKQYKNGKYRLGPNQSIDLGN